MAPRRPSARRTRIAPRLWSAWLLPLALVLTLLGRGHVYQAMGWLPCWDDTADAEARAEPHDGQGDVGHAHEDCPAGCHQCPCGQIPMVPPSVSVPEVEAVLALTELEEWTPPPACGEAHPHRVDRPPRPVTTS
ncbi:MAG: hypothetical protein IT372_05595 [Polyangiaceae bacterium]|nr:hypothetical protein [Polyangiaceae bacterium]